MSRTYLRDATVPPLQLRATHKRSREHIKIRVPLDPGRCPVAGTILVMVGRVTVGDTTIRDSAEEGL